MRADIGDLSKSNQAIFEVTESPKSNIPTYNVKEFAKKRDKFLAFIQKIRLYEPVLYNFSGQKWQERKPTNLTA